MGLREILTTPIGFASAAFRWKEPFAYRNRLREDVVFRLAVIAAAWMMAFGVLCVLFAVNVKPPGIPLALFLGAVFGLGPAALILLARRDHVSGRVTVTEDAIHRKRNYAGIGAQWFEEQEWPLEDIERAVLVPGEVVGHPFSLLLLSSGDSGSLIGVPASVDTQKLGKFLHGKGITLSRGTSVPAKYTRPGVTPMIAGIAVALGIILGGSGLMYYVMNVGA